MYLSITMSLEPPHGINLVSVLYLTIRKELIYLHFQFDFSIINGHINEPRGKFIPEPLLGIMPIKHILSYTLNRQQHHTIHRSSEYN